VATRASRARSHHAFFRTERAKKVTRPFPSRELPRHKKTRGCRARGRLRYRALAYSTSPHRDTRASNLRARWHARPRRAFRNRTFFGAIRVVVCSRSTARRDEMDASPPSPPSPLQTMREDTPPSSRDGKEAQTPTPSSPPPDPMDVAAGALAETDDVDESSRAAAPRDAGMWTPPGSSREERPPPLERGVRGGYAGVSDLQVRGRFRRRRVHARSTRPAAVTDQIRGRGRKNSDAAWPVFSFPIIRSIPLRRRRDRRRRTFSSFQTARSSPTYRCVSSRPCT
jgi:hypothetical protein